MTGLPAGSPSAGVQPAALETIGARLTRLGGSATGFDYLRIGLATCVVVWHSLETSYSGGTSVRVWNDARCIVSLILPMFFALSGFLVCGSLIRTKSILVFLTHRALRLLPALFVEIILSALILGVSLTTLPHGLYFQSREFYLYFLNIVGDIHFYLPGVFLSNPLPGVVNKSLWTIPYELQCYLSVVVIFILGLSQHPRLFLGLVLLGIVGDTILVDAQASPILQIVGPPGRLLLFSFVCGLLLFLWRDRVPLSLPGFVFALVASLVLLSFPYTMLLAAVPVAYVTAWLGMTTPKRIPVLMDGDYSYGLYLFAYPLQQTYSYLFPGERHWWLNVGWGVGLGLLYAAFSWHCVEKQVLGRRKHIVAVVERLSALPTRYLAAVREGRRGSA